MEGVLGLQGSECLEVPLKFTSLSKLNSRGGALLCVGSCCWLCVWALCVGSCCWLSDAIGLLQRVDAMLPRAHDEDYV